MWFLVIIMLQQGGSLWWFKSLARSLVLASDIILLSIRIFSYYLLIWISDKIGLTGRFGRSSRRTLPSAATLFLAILTILIKVFPTMNLLSAGNRCRKSQLPCCAGSNRNLRFRWSSPDRSKHPLVFRGHDTIRPPRGSVSSMIYLFLILI